MSEPAAIAAPAAAPSEVLTARAWCRLLGITQQAFRARCVPSGTAERRGRGLQLFACADLPADYRATLDTLRARHGAADCAALLDMARAEFRGWQPARPWLQNKPSVRFRATMKRDAMAVWWAALRRGVRQEEAARMVSEEYLRLCGKTVCARNVWRWAKMLASRGGEFAPLDAYVDEKQTAHPSARLAVPEEFIAAVRSKVLSPGVEQWAAAVRSFALAWQAGDDVPGLGRAARPDEPFPFTAKQLQKFCPSKAARVSAARGKFAAKCAGLLPAPPIGSRELRLREIVAFDDKRLDIVALDDQTGRPVSLVLYLAMDFSSRQILGYILRADGNARQNDVEALAAFLLRVAGFAGANAGYATTLVFERGTVAISAERAALLEAMFPGQIRISRTAMIGGSGPGEFRQSASGNFFGKGKLESFMRTLDCYLRHVAGQRGNVYANEPAMLGDLLTTAERIASPQYKLRGTMIEEAVLCAEAAKAIHFATAEKGASLSAADASAATEIRPPLLFVREVQTAIQAAIAFYNSERGHRREGFLEMAVPSGNGGHRRVAESANDKAARLQTALHAQGRSLQQISAADAAVLLHKVIRVSVRPGGARVRLNGRERLYWHPDSLAVAAAQQSSAGEKIFLALVNPCDPRELYLLHNPPSHVRTPAEDLPPGEEAHFFEALPLYDAPDANDELALASRAASVARNHSRIKVEIVRNTVPFTAAQTARRERNIESVSEPLRAAALTVLREEGARAELPPTAIGAAFAEHAEDADAARDRHTAGLRRAKPAPEPFDER